MRKVPNLERESVSIGFNCDSASAGVSEGIRSKRCDGYKTCVFDMIISNLSGVIQCFEDDFRYFCDTDYLQQIKMPDDLPHYCTNDVGEMVIINIKYNFLFNHESTWEYFNIEKWEKGIDHFVMNNYEEFINRFNRRINNLRELLKSGKHITFILTRPDTELEDISELVEVIKRKYPVLKFDFKLRDYCKNHYHKFLLLMGVDKNDKELIRLRI